jgi:hypothetical protein
MTSAASRSKKRRKRKARAVSLAGRKAFTISEFAARHNISRNFFYQLKRLGKAPRVTELGAKLLIMEEDETA